MPEGDTIHRAAARLRPALEGARLHQLVVPRRPGPLPRPGTVIDAVRAQGKHLLVAFADGRTLQTHLGMTGSWHLYRSGQPWQKPRHLARAVIEVPEWVAVCFSAPTVRLLSSPADVGLTLGHLGPDLCALDDAARPAALDAAVARMEVVADPGADIADVLLDQRIAAGIGNVYKSEVLWACELDPFTPVRSVATEVRRALLEVATDQLQANLGPGRRTTVRGGLAVYGRARRPCRRCEAPVRRRLSGPHQRSTYWCPGCQRSPGLEPRSTRPTIMATNGVEEDDG